MPPEGSPARRVLTVAAVAVLAVGVAIALVLLIDSGPGEEGLTRHELLVRGDRICRQAHRQFAHLQRQRPTTAVDAEQLTSTLIGIAENERDELSSLDGPDQLDAKVDRYLRARERGIELLHQGLEAAQQRDGAAYLDAQAKLARDQLERERIARRIGFTQCSRPITSEAELAEDARPPASSALNAPPRVNNPPIGTP
jgi:hypothetical protein